MSKRLPRHDLGVANPSKKMADLLPQILSDLKPSDCKKQIFQYWNELMGEKMSLMALPTSFTDGVLTVKVKNSTFYALLVTHEKQRLLKKLQEKFSIRNLVFRVG